jgi:hypothetical protein
MTESTDYKPRFSFEITDEQMKRANNLLAQYGLRKAIFGKILDDVLDAIESSAGLSIGLLMSEPVVMKGIVAVLTEKTVKPRKERKEKNG